MHFRRRGTGNPVPIMHVSMSSKEAPFDMPNNFNAFSTSISISALTHLDRRHHPSPRLTMHSISVDLICTLCGTHWIQVLPTVEALVPEHDGGGGVRKRKKEKGGKRKRRRKKTSGELPQLGIASSGPSTLSADYDMESFFAIDLGELEQSCNQVSDNGKHGFNSKKGRRR
ncbi:hypothetical protein JHK84_050392 [Glycine max]|nr:hypothetical protein JHK84_050392 [Glycine max]